MAEAAKKVEQMPNTRTDQQIFLKGKLDQVEVVGANKDLFRNIIITPAKDEYSHPQRWCVMTRSRLGGEGDVVSVFPEVRCRPWKDNNGSWRYPHELWAD